MMFGNHRITKLEAQIDAINMENVNLRSELTKLAAENAKLKMENSTLLQNIRVLKQYENLFNYDGTQQKNNLDGGGD